MKILIPTDFSQLSKIAIQYVIGLSKDIELDMVVLHVVNTTKPTMARLSSKKLIESIKKSTEWEMEELIKTIKTESGHDLKIDAQIINDSSIEKGVETYALQHDIDIICIGTKGATGLKKIIFGSNAAGIISNSSVPVLTIPEFASYSGINNIIYSSDLENLEEELKVLIPFAKKMDTWVHVLHINKLHGDPERNLQSRENRIISLLSYEKIKTKELENDSIINGINQYVKDVEADMVAMFTHKASLIDKLLKKSVTKEAAFQTRTPLLTFQKEKK
tara:strand:+ start:2502 stop:3329 length:828 start_codon:yes stop_codon:yes gene_type:complete